MVETSGFEKMIEEFQELPPQLQVTPNPEVQVQTLVENYFFDQQGLKNAARKEAMKALITISEQQYSCMVIEGPVERATQESSNKISFYEDDREAKFTHNRPLYVSALINGLEVGRAFIDNEASVNIMPLKTFCMLGLPKQDHS